MTIDMHGSKLVDTRLGNTVQWYLSPREDIDMRVPDEIRKCVVFVGLPFAFPVGQERLRFKGTAFFVSIQSESLQGIWYVYLVTAKHVATELEGKRFLVRINTKDGRSKLIVGEGVRWWYHPTDDLVDVAVIPYAPPVEEFDYRTIPVNMFLTDDIIRQKSIGTGDEVFITGLFAHLSGMARNLPVVRMGNIAMMPEELVPTSLGDIEAYLIEARSIGGLSGSPAFVRETVGLGLGSFYLLGLMHGHWDIPIDTKSDIEDIDSIAPINVGIAIVIPAKKILEVLNQPSLIEVRRQGDEKRRKETMPTLDEHAAKASQGQDK